MPRHVPGPKVEPSTGNRLASRAEPTYAFGGSYPRARKGKIGEAIGCNLDGAYLRLRDRDFRPCRWRVPRRWHVCRWWLAWWRHHEWRQLARQYLVGWWLARRHLVGWRVARWLLLGWLVVAERLRGWRGRGSGAGLSLLLPVPLLRPIPILRGARVYAAGSLLLAAGLHGPRLASCPAGSRISEWKVHAPG